MQENEGSFEAWAAVQQRHPSDGAVVPPLMPQTLDGSEKGIMKNFSIISFAFLLGSSVIWSEEPQSPFEKALELYKEGPSRAKEIIELLKKELETNPENEKAMRLLGITYFGIEEFEKALVQFDELLEINEKKKNISPRILFYKARTLYYLERYEEAKHIWEVYQAFWEGDEELKKQYEYYYPKVLGKLKEIEGKK